MSRDDTVTIDTDETYDRDRVSADALLAEFVAGLLPEAVAS